MKLIKVGSSPSCGIVIPSNVVSSYHADITVLDNGDVLIADKNSTNGTYVGVNKTKLTPNQEVKIKRGDRVLFGNEMLDWSRVPQAPKYPGAKRIVNIGSSQRNELVVPGSGVSRYHAQLVIDKDGHAMIVDNDSTNGTIVNGKRISSGRPERIKRGDNVIVGQEDITAEITPYIPSNKGLKILLGSVAAILVIGAIIGAAFMFWPKSEVKDSAVVLVRNVYHFELEPADNPYKLPIKLVSKHHYAITGTAFFIDEEGRLGTCRHVVAPWLEEYQDIDVISQMKIQDSLRQDWDEYIKTILPTDIKTEGDLVHLGSTKIGQSIIEAALNMKNNLPPIKNIQNILERMRSTMPKIVGKSDVLSIAYANRYYKNPDEYEPCVLIGESGDKDKDVAIIQVNKKETPEKIIKNGIFYVKNFVEKKPDVQGMSLKFMGYPEGVIRLWDDHVEATTNVPTMYQGKVMRIPNPYTFEVQATTTHGASGAPVYSGSDLYGVVTAGHTAGDDMIATDARWLKELYEKNVIHLLGR